MERLDHVIFRAEKLTELVEEFRAAGFKVYYGAPTGKEYNAMIYFEDHSFIELVDMTKVPGFAKVLTRLGVFKLIHPFFHRMGNWALSDNIIMEYVAYSSDIRAFQQQFKGSSSKVRTGTRINHMSEAVSWEYFGSKDLELPFVISDYRPKKYPEEGATQHPNGATGIKELVVHFSGSVEAFKSKVIQFFKPSPENVEITSSGFSLMTANAKIRYILSSDYHIESLMLKESVSPKYDLSAYGVH